MKKEKIINFFIIIFSIIAFLYMLNYWSSKRYEAQKIFFINSCVDTFYYDNGYNFNEIVNDFNKELPQNIQGYIEEEFLGRNGYLDYIEPESIENLCENIFDFYKEAEEENEYNHCEQYRCR